MKVTSYLGDIPLDELSPEEHAEFARAAQIKMLNIAGYTPVGLKDTIDLKDPNDKTA